MKKRTMQNILLLTVLTLLLCACLAGCVGVAGRNNDVEVNIGSKGVSDKAEDAPAPKDTDNTTDQSDAKPQSTDVYIENITNSDGGVINIYYTVKESSGEEWQGEIRFDPNGGVAADGATMAWDKNKQYVNLACPFVREGYDFFGWSLEPSGDPYIYKMNDDFSAYPISKVIALAKANDKEGDLTFYAIWRENQTLTKTYSYPIIYKSVNGTLLGSSIAVGTYGTVQEIVAPAKSGYDTPEAQTVLWDVVEKTITFLYQPTATAPASKEGSYSNDPVHPYVVTLESKNRTADSVEVRVVGTVSMVQSTPTKHSDYGHRMRVYVGGEYYYVDIVKFGTTFSGGGTVGVDRSATADTGWIKVALNSTEQTEISADIYIYQTSYNGSDMSEAPYYFSNASFRLASVIPAY